ncbi:acetoacetyl-CoA synthetase [Betaproteobacteria bacterium UKL13-2]|jgi:acetoacetyl-CoA synthetase|nr:acetoacetyl-CoA synthetase [Betaproteobacteria bacterium UKL13-2]HCG52345.1 acetoacetate--CoA ligase [Betaproteobacteria bacterium]
MNISQLPIWTPTPERIANANVTAFMHALNDAYGLQMSNYHALYEWSVTNPQHFWSAVWDFCGVVGERGVAPGIDIMENEHLMPGAKFFPKARINFAENLIEREFKSRTDCDAMIFWGEDKLRKRVTYRELDEQVSRWQQAMRTMGVKKGDRVAAFMPNMPEAVIAMLAATSLGAVWTSCSPDFGVQGVVDRFGQVEPVLLIACDGYLYNGKAVPTLARIAECVEQLPSVQRVVVVPYLHDIQTEVPAMDVSSVPGAVSMGDFIGGYQPAAIQYVRVGFNDPLYIMYSSGTTGVPKCIVHGVGGTLLKHLEEHILQCDVKAGDKVFFFTTCGWMMWNWLVSGLAANATLILFDGSPFLGRGNILFDYVAADDVTHFGAGAKFYESLAKIKVNPGKTHKLCQLRSVMSTGSPLSPEGFQYIYDNIKSDVCLSSISGGTDIIGCFVGGVPVLPVYSGEIQTRMLGMAVDAWDDEGKPIRGEKGELVCTKPFPSMPIGFWHDHDGRKYRAAYFEHFPNVWTHGDYVEITERGGMVIYGRSDAVLNPGGVRIGTAEIYRQVEKLDEVLESVVIGQDWPPEKPGDVRVVLFVRLVDGCQLNADLEKRIKEVIRVNTTMRHVPAKILAVPDIPRTKSGKIVELAVRNVVHGTAVKNREALANPDALQHFAMREELKS